MVVRLLLTTASVTPWKPTLRETATVRSTPVAPAVKARNSIRALEPSAKEKLLGLGRTYAAIVGYPRAHGPKIAEEHVMTLGSTELAEKALNKAVRAEDKRTAKAEKAEDSKTHVIRLEQHLDNLPKPNVRAFEPKRKWVEQVLTSKNLKPMHVP